MSSIIKLLEQITKCDLKDAIDKARAMGLKNNSSLKDDILIFTNKKGIHVASYDKEDEEFIVHDVDKETKERRGKDTDIFKKNRDSKILKRSNQYSKGNFNTLDTVYEI